MRVFWDVWKEIMELFLRENAAGTSNFPEPRAKASEVW